MKSLAVLAVFSAFLFFPHTTAPRDAGSSSEALKAADRAWCQAIVDRDIERFSSMLTENAIYAGTMGPVTSWREAIKNGWAPYFKAGGPTITWSPTTAEVLGGGDVGYTKGAFERHAKDEKGRETVIRGEYLTVFRRQADGSWKVFFDTGSVKPNK